MKKQFIFFVFLNAFAQFDAGVKLNIGLSKVSNTRIAPLYEIKQRYVPSGNLGFFIDFNLKKKFVISSEILFLQIEGKEKDILTQLDGNGNYDYSDIILDKHISYLAIPIYIGIRGEKIHYKLGFQTALLLFSKGKDRGEPNNEIGGPRSPVKEAHKLNIDQYDFGPKAAISYKLNEKLSLEANYYFGVNNILPANNLYGYKWRNQQMAIGFQYKLIPDKKSENLKT